MLQTGYRRLSVYAAVHCLNMAYFISWSKYKVSQDKVPKFIKTNIKFN